MSFEDVTLLGSVVNCFDSKRIPLSTRERESKQGHYPYYGAAGIIDHVNKPIFSGLYLLMGEDGSVVEENGTPVLQLVSGEFWVNNHAHVLQGETDLETRFIYYALKNTNIQGFVTGAVQPKLNQANMNNIPIYFPEKSARVRIVETLGCLDEKIELNRQTNATLEAIAQAIFKEWFVDFNFPGATGEMVDSELGPIPKGWHLGYLKNLCSPVNEKVLPLTMPSHTPYVGLEHLPRKSLGLQFFGKAGDIFSQKNCYHKFDILFGKLRPYFHKVCIAPNEGVCSTDILVLRPFDTRLFSFCLNHIFSDTFISYASANADGTRMPRVNWDILGKFKIPSPPMAQINEFSEIAMPLYVKILELNKESYLLSIARDTLLARLMQ